MIPELKQRRTSEKDAFWGTFLTSILTFLSCAIFLIEFVFDVRQSHDWHRTLLFFDVSLIAVYSALIIQKSFTHSHHLWRYYADHMADALYCVVICSFLFLPRFAAALIIVRLLYACFEHFLASHAGEKFINFLNLRPSQTLALSFLGLIAVSSLLLTFPAATVDGRGAKFIDALFTMTAASCVAGLTVLDIGVQFTRFGQGVILIGIQAGGLGIMVLSAAFTLMVGGRISLRKQAGLSQVLDVATPDGFRSILRSVTITTLVIEFFGALSLFILCAEEVPKIGDRLWWSIFHTVSAFCNCGLGLFSNSLMTFIDRPVVCFIFISLIVMGGLGFIVLSDITDREVWAVKNPYAIWSRLEIQTKVMILSVLFLNVFGSLVFLFFEYDGVLRGLPFDEKILAAVFQTVNLRSAGFSIVPLGGLQAPTIMFSIAYMFIGAGPGSTGGGIKVTTAAISAMAVRSMLYQRQDVELFGRRLSSEVVSKSLAIVLISATFVAVFFTLLLATQNIPFDKLFFETVSAFGTVGLSLDTTTMLSSLGKLLIIIVMFVGRIGPLTLALAIGQKNLAQFRYPKGNLAVG